MNIIKSACSCGKPILIELGLAPSACFRADGKRPHYEGDHPTCTQLRCRKCGGWLADTCPDAKHEFDKAIVRSEPTVREY